MTFAEYLAAALRARGWSQADLRRALARVGAQAEAPTINHWVRGRTRPRGELLRALVRALALDEAEELRLRRLADGQTD